MPLNASRRWSSSLDGIATFSGVVRSPPPTRSTSCTNRRSDGSQRLRNTHCTTIRMTVARPEIRRIR
jgi:hypothetical protein